MIFQNIEAQQELLQKALIEPTKVCMSETTRVTMATQLIDTHNKLPSEYFHSTPSVDPKAAYVKVETQYGQLHIVIDNNLPENIAIVV